MSGLSLRLIADWGWRSSTNGRALALHKLQTKKKYLQQIYEGNSPYSKTVMIYMNKHTYVIIKNLAQNKIPGLGGFTVSNLKPLGGMYYQSFSVSFRKL